MEKMRITITINKEIHKELSLLKINNDYKTFDEVLKFLLLKINEKKGV